MADTRRLPDPNPDSWAWQQHGSCRGMDEAVFFHPDNERGPARAARERRAKSICARCPVREACLRHALATREAYGIWGGTTALERVSARDRVAAAP